MSELGEGSVVEQARPAMPEARLLNYIGGVTSPTRVRTVAAVGVGSFAVVFFVLGAYCLYWVIDTFYRLWGYRMEAWRAGWRPAPPTFQEILRETLGYSVGVLFLMCVLSGIGLALLLLARLVHRGRAWACHMSLAPVLGAMPLCFLGSVASGMYFVVRGFGLWRFPRSIPLALVLFVLFWVGCAFLLVLRDLVTYLLWIAKAPAAEKEFVAFLPGR